MASYPRMVTGAKSPPNPYKHLAFLDYTDWVHVDPKILKTLDTMAGELGKTITVISGYRDPAYSSKVGGYSSDPHTRGVAVDAYIGATPIGSVPGAKDLIVKAGLESGAQPGFYRGKEDPEHIQVPGSGVNKSIHAGSWVPPKWQTTNTPHPTDSGGAPVAPTYQTPNLQLPTLPTMLPPGQPELYAAEVVLPGTVYNTLPHPDYQQTWQQIAAQPYSSPESQRLAQLAQVVTNG